MSSRRRSPRMPSPALSPPTPSLTYIPDDVVLKRTPESKADLSNEWVTFDLEDAIVLDKTGKKIENGLLVETRGPFIVRGCLKIDRTNREQVSQLQPAYRRIESVYIEIFNSQKYSIGTDEIRPLIYLSGPCGWFELEPSQEYLAMYSHMGLCVDMYWAFARSYNVSDGEEIPQWRLNNPDLPSVDEALCRYAIDVGDGSTRSSVLERCRSFAPFLAHHMSHETGTRHLWAYTAIYRMLEQMAQSQQGREPHRPSPQPVDYYKMPSPRPGSPIPLSRRLRRGGGVANLPAQARTRRSPVAKREEPPSPSPPTAPPVRRPVAGGSPRYQEGLESLATALLDYWVPDQRPRSLNGSHSSVALYLYLIFTIKEYKNAQQLVAYYAKDLLPLLDAQDAEGTARQAAMPWSRTQFYTWLRRQVTEFRPTPLTKDAHPFIFHRRTVKGSYGAQGTQGTPRATPSAPAGKGKLPRPTGGLRPTGSKKRAAADDAFDEWGDGVRSHKQSKTSHYFDEDEMDLDNDDSMQQEVDADQDHDSSHACEPTDDDADDDDDEDTNRASVRVVVEVERMPSITPRGPLGTWKCEFKGCKAFVRAFEDQESMIQQHLQTHEADASTRAPPAAPPPAQVIDLTGPDDETGPDNASAADGKKQDGANADMIQLAVAEGKQSLLPINHLLDKIKRFGSQKEKAAVVLVNGTPVPIPAPIKRRVLY